MQYQHHARLCSSFFNSAHRNLPLQKLAEPRRIRRLDSSAAPQTVFRPSSSASSCQSSSVWSGCGDPRALRACSTPSPQSWVVGVQFYRVLGVIFLLLNAQGRLPSLFALPAGAGDIAVGLLAPIVALAYARGVVGPRGAGSRLERARFARSRCRHHDRLSRPRHRRFRRFPSTRRTSLSARFRW